MSDYLLAVSTDLDREPFVCELPLAPRNHIAGAFRSARPHCVWCIQPVAPGDPIACPDHRRQMDAIVMPWEDR